MLFRDVCADIIIDLGAACPGPTRVSVMGDAEQLIAEAAGGYLLEEGHTLLLSSLDESIIFKMDGPLAWLCLGAFYIQDKLSPGPQSSDLPLVQTPAYTQRANKQTNKQIHRPRFKPQHPLSSLERKAGRMLDARCDVTTPCHPREATCPIHPPLSRPSQPRGTCGPVREGGDRRVPSRHISPPHGLRLCTTSLSGAGTSPSTAAGLSSPQLPLAVGQQCSDCV